MSAPTVHEFIRELDANRTHYVLTSVREGAVMVQVTLPGERWEIEFFDDRETEVEVFRSDGEHVWAGASISIESHLCGLGIRRELKRRYNGGDGSKRTGPNLLARDSKGRYVARSSPAEAPQGRTASRLVWRATGD